MRNVCLITSPKRLIFQYVSHFFGLFFDKISFRNIKHQTFRGFERTLINSKISFSNWIFLSGHILKWTDLQLNVSVYLLDKFDEWTCNHKIVCNSIAITIFEINHFWMKKEITLWNVLSHFNIQKAREFMEIKIKKAF